MRMFDETNGPAARVVEIRRRTETEKKGLTVNHHSDRPLVEVLAKLRSEMDGLAIRLAREHGKDCESTLRAEQISHAIQRLEWALNREETDYRPAN